ncbi:hypothetical protein CEE37_05930 [candidate division LCP-89 bacterium B3_LCP]|uniref:Secretion system C-terminal sorting domain-containing protein n=1 Tax=candidate division LCP-89 bacterium B3_LCP TaxID=2012998 RepID=A0A532V246_UNCL8|nr:MAG: hypothetical protein CEE37_05930 [candidate division LCP-89 bacterium B3_LCP]
MRFLLMIIVLPMLVYAHEFEFQQEFETIPVEIDGWPPFVPWAGGYTESAPDFVDIDADLDLDLFVGEYLGFPIPFFRNNGDLNFPQYELEDSLSDSLRAFDNDSRTNPEFYDLDNDGDLDAIIGCGYVTLVENIGTATEPNFNSLREQLFDTDSNWVFGTHVSLIDIDDDDDGDLICGEYQGHLQFYRNIGTPDSFSFNLEDDFWLGISVGDDADPALCDIDSDNDLDLFIGEKYGKIWYYLNEGDSINYNFIYQSDNYANIDVGDYASPEFADIDGDGDYDLFVGSEENGIYYYENRGDPQNPYFTPITDNYLTIDLENRTNPKLVDINDDGKLDLFAPDYTSLHYFENIGTMENPHFQFIQEGWQSVARESIKPFFVDIDADGDQDLFCGEGVIPGPPTLALYINHGTPQEPELILYDPEYITNGAFHVNINPGLTDIDADGDYDLFISAGQGKFYFYQNDGDQFTPEFTYVDSQWQGIQFYYPTYNWKGFTFGDLDNDEDFDLLIEAPWANNLYFYRNIGTPEMPNMYLEAEMFFDPVIQYIYTPFLSNIDSDTDLDLFIGDEAGGIFFFRNVTGQNEVGPRRPDIPFPKLDFSIGPNPANPVTWISFTLPSPQEATLAVYNILGAKVTTLTSGLQTPGTHSYIWDAADYSSGVYIIQLETPQQTSSNRITVLK